MHVYRIICFIIKAAFWPPNENSLQIEREREKKNPNHNHLPWNVVHLAELENRHTHTHAKKKAAAAAEEEAKYSFIMVSLHQYIVRIYITKTPHNLVIFIYSPFYRIICSTRCNG